MTELEADQATDKFLADHKEAIADLVRKVGDEALAKLHCLALWGNPKVHQRLRDLIRRTLRMRIAQEGEVCDHCYDESALSKWGDDDLFIVVVDDTHGPGLPRQWKIKVALRLADSVINE